MEFEELFAIYYHQIVHGCEAISCDNKFCRSSPSFEGNDKDPTELALKYAEEHTTTNRICKYLSKLITSPLIVGKISLANLFLISFASNGKPSPESVDAFKYAIGNINAFSYLFLSDDRELEPNNLLFDDATIGQFVKVANQMSGSMSPFISSDDFKDSVLYNVINGPEPTLRNIRAHILLFVFECVFNKKEVYLRDIIRAICRFDSKRMNIFVNCLAESPKVLAYIAQIARRILDPMCNEKVKPHCDELHSLASFIEILSHANMLSRNPLPQSCFESEALCKIISVEMEFKLIKDNVYSYANTPSVLTPVFKSGLIESETQYLNKMNHNTKLNITVQRQSIITSASKELASKQFYEFQKKVNVSFKGEKGQDDGGVFREFISLLTCELTKPEMKLFVSNNDLLWFSSKRTDTKAHELFGIAAGLAISNQVILPVRFPFVFFKKLAGWPVTENDFAMFDKETYNGILETRKSIKQGGDVKEELCLVFADTDEDGNDVEIVPDGLNKEVDNSNYEEYVSALIDYKLNRSIGKQFDAFKNGFLKVCNKPIIKMLTPYDLELFFCGDDKYNWEDFKKSTVYGSDYSPNSDTIKHFWSVFFKLDEDKKKKFLMFVTGSDRAPIGGLISLKVTINRCGDTKLLPTAHTCQKILVLPDYRNYSKMEKNILICTKNSQGIGII